MGCCGGEDDKDEKDGGGGGEGKVTPARNDAIKKVREIRETRQR